ncbi:hypothetical protein DPMN_123728 [Dreissena polymorpha]|uniref:Uncharacterized protein n=1 Tax=Dreissena polymorpha TaxID=45954 RepID=A0A9D4JRJ9_DREPO|nr:hypothetical protein DPMN_123728 [Dreissena polymorpha]
MSPGVQGAERESRDCLNPSRLGFKTVVAGRLFHIPIAHGEMKTYNNLQWYGSVCRRGGACDE